MPKLVSDSWLVGLIKEIFLTTSLDKKDKTHSNYNDTITLRLEEKIWIQQTQKKPTHIEQSKLYL